MRARSVLHPAARSLASVLVVLLSVGPVILASCGPDGFGSSSGEGDASEGAAGEGSLRLSMAGLALDGANTIRVTLYRGGVVDATLAPVYESGCDPIGSDQPRVTSLPLADDYAVRVDIYSDAVCATLSYRGARGGIEVTKAGNEEAPYVIPLVAVDAFTALPGLVGRPTDSSPGHFPLNASRRRVFHAATALGDGRVAFLGGADSWDGSQLIAGVGQPELFDTRTMMFSFPPGGSVAGERMMAHAAVTLPDGRVAVAAGVQGFRFHVDDESAVPRLKFDVPAEVCYGGPDCPVTVPNFVYSLTLVDLTNGAVRQWSLADPRVFPTLDVVRTSAGETMILAGGVPGYPAWEQNDAFACRVPRGGDVQCDPLDLVAHRAGQSSGCFGTDTDGVCTALALLGGAAAGQPYAEWIGGANDEFTAAALDGAPTERVLLPQAAGGDGAILAAGGIVGAKLSDTPRGGPSLITLDATGAGRYAPFPAGAGLPAETGQQVMHTVTALGNGRFLVAGGLDPDLVPTDRAIVLRLEGDGLRTERSDLGLHTARFGHTATRIVGGPLDGAVLFVGGMTAGATGEWELARTTEIFYPSSAAKP